MFDLFGNIQEQQEAIAIKLKEVEIEHTSSDKLISIKINANKEILDLSIQIDAEKGLDIAQLEDQMIVTLNEAFEKANVAAEKVSSAAINDLLPGGLGGIGGLFGQ